MSTQSPDTVSGRRGPSRWYWALAGVLVVFGFLTGFSIGLPFLLLGYVLFALGPFRHRRRVFWPVLAGVVVFEVGFILVSPLGCTTSATETTTADGVTMRSGGATRCSNILGIDYRGGSGYDPPRWPAASLGLAAGVAAGAATRFLLKRSSPAV